MTKQKIEDDAEETTADVPTLYPHEQVFRLFDDFQTMANAEYDYYRARLTYSAGVAKSTSLMVALGLFSLFGAIVALILGLLLSLGALVGFLLATIIIVTCFAGATFCFAWAARRNVRKLKFGELSESDTGGEPHD